MFLDDCVFVDDDIVEHFIKFEVAKLNWALSLSQWPLCFFERETKGLQHVCGWCLELKLGIFFFSRYLLCHYIGYITRQFRDWWYVENSTLFVGFGDIKKCYCDNKWKTSDLYIPQKGSNIPCIGLCHSLLNFGTHVIAESCLNYIFACFDILTCFFLVVVVCIVFNKQLRGILVC